MGEIDQVLREVLAARVGDAPQNTLRGVQVRARARRIRRGQIGAVAAVVLVAGVVSTLLAAAGVRDETLPPALDTPQKLVAAVAGAEPVGSTTSQVRHANTIDAGLADGRPMLFVLRCAQRGTQVSLSRHDGEPLGQLACTHRSGRAFEGRLEFSAPQATQIFVFTGLPVAPSEPEAVWRLDAFQVGLNDRSVPGTAVIDGRAPHAATGTYRAPSNGMIQVSIECLGNVTVRVDVGGLLRRDFRCQTSPPDTPDREREGHRAGFPQDPILTGQFSAGERVTINAEVLHADTDQWRLLVTDG